ncbi:MAG: DegV family protein [Clostridia bacterium]|nr:DegV family protein [Clostridia bacterium]
MADYVLTCCSSADLSKERFDARNIKYLCFHYSLNGVEYPDDLGQTMPPAMLYERMLAGESTKTSQPSAGEYMEFFEKYLEQGLDILHVTLSTGISGAYNSAMVAADQVRAKFPGRKVYVVDSLGASSGYGLIMETLADLRDKGKTIEELNDWLHRHRLNMHHWFFSTDLTFYIKGGRVSKTSGFLGNMLGICPLLNMDNFGRLIPREKILGKKRVIRRTVEKMVENAVDGQDYAGKVFICQSECPEDAQRLADLVKEKFPKMRGEPEIFPIGATIGSHTGPGTVSLFFWGKKRND